MEGGVPKFKKSKSRDPGDAHFGFIQHSSSAVYSTRHGRTNKEKMKSLASSVQTLWRGY